jgi:hypothetical protein
MSETESKSRASIASGKPLKSSLFRRAAGMGRA